MTTLPQTPFADAVERIFEKVSGSMPDNLAEPVKAVLVGGAAVHIYTEMRVSDDVEAIFEKRILLPQDLLVRYLDSKGQQKTLAYDYNYFSEIALLHPDAVDEAYTLHRCIDGKIDLYVLTPVDLAVAKVARFQDRDRNDIKALASAGLLNDLRFRQRAEEALQYYVGNTFWVEQNIQDVVHLIRARMDNDDGRHP